LTETSRMKETRRMVEDFDIRLIESAFNIRLFRSHFKRPVSVCGTGRRKSGIWKLLVAFSAAFGLDRGILALPQTSETMVLVMRARQSGHRQAGIPAFVAILALAVGPVALCAQSPNPTSAVNPFYGSVTLRPASEDVVKLSLDEAVQRGLKNNLGLKEAESGEKDIKAQKLEALQNFLPTINLTGSNGFYQHNLAALGFGPSTFAMFAKLFPGGVLPAGLSEITKDDLTQGQIQYGQMLFSGPVIAAYRGAKAAEKAAYFAKMSARGEVVQQVARAYLYAIAAASEVDNARAQEAEDKLLLTQVHAAHEAGTAANLEELRARVQLQAQQQALIGAENALEKSLILLKREIGIDPGQKIELTDPAPYSELAAQTPEEVRAVAYRSRQDYQNLQNHAVGLRLFILSIAASACPA